MSIRTVSTWAMCPLLLSLTFSGCQEPPLITMQLETPAQLAEAAARRDLSASEARALEARVIDEIVARVPSELRAAARAELAPRSSDLATIVSTDNPDIRDLFSALRSLRSPNRVGTTPPTRTPEGDSERSVRVQVTLVDELPDATATAVILRSTTDRGTPVLLLPVHSFTERDLEFGLRMAARMADDSIAIPASGLRRVFRRSGESRNLDAGGTPSPRLTALATLIKRQEISGTGATRGRSLTIALPDRP